MKIYYCEYHKKFLTKTEIEQKKCKRKSKNRKKCKHLRIKIEKPKYRNYQKGGFKA